MSIYPFSKFLWLPKMDLCVTKVAPQARSPITRSRRCFCPFTPSPRNIFRITFTCTMFQTKFSFSRLLHDAPSLLKPQARRKRGEGVLQSPNCLLKLDDFLSANGRERQGPGNDDSNLSIFDQFTIQLKINLFPYEIDIFGLQTFTVTLTCYHVISTKSFH